MKAAVTVLNWNTKDYLRSFLPGLIAACPDGTEVIVADSGSTDGSVQVLKEVFPMIKTVLLDRNYGFTGGYNKAFKELESRGIAPDYYILVNSDIDVSAGWMEPLIEWMDCHPECGICGPKLHGLLRSNGGYFRSSRFEYAGAAGGMIDRFGFPYCRGRIRKKVENDNGQYDNADPEVLWVTGSCLMIRRSLWETLGGLDDKFFAHMEEIDLCWRAQLNGWKVNVVPASTVWHLGGGTLPPTSPFKLKLNFRNNLLLLCKNYYPTLIAKGHTVHKATRKTRNMLRFRLFLDNCAAFVYFCTGRPAFARAVREAHKEWRSFGISPFESTPDGTPRIPSGLSGKLILLM